MRAENEHLFPPGLDAPDNYVQECAVHGAFLFWLNTVHFKGPLEEQWSLSDTAAVMHFNNTVNKKQQQQNISI